jgi:hypothetical protein
MLLELCHNVVQRRCIGVDQVDASGNRNRITAEDAANREQRVQQPSVAAATEQHQSLPGVQHQG